MTVDSRYNHHGKVYVEVNATFDRDGELVPHYFVWEDGRKYEIDQIISKCRAASLKAGGVGIRYTCRIRERETYLFREEDKWFMERRDKQTDA